MKLLLDTCVAGGAKTHLEAAGHDVVWGGDWPTDPGDDELLARAHAEGRVLVTLDKDFGELAVHRGLAHCGIVRLVGFRSIQQGPAAQAAVDAHADDLKAGAIVTAEPGRLRIRLSGTPRRKSVSKRCGADEVDQRVRPRGSWVARTPCSMWASPRTRARLAFLSRGLPVSLADRRGSRVRGSCARCYAWYLERSLRVADAFLAELERGLRLIAAAPESWPPYSSALATTFSESTPTASSIRPLGAPSSSTPLLTPSAGRAIGRTASGDTAGGSGVRSSFRMRAPSPVAGTAHSRGASGAAFDSGP